MRKGFLSLENMQMILVSSVEVGPPHGIEVVEQSVLEKLDALAAAWLPGNEGNGITDVIFGDYEFHGQLPVSWFRTASCLLEIMSSMDSFLSPGSEQLINCLWMLIKTHMIHCFHLGMG
ncbi:putative glycosyl hydrolase family protein [Tanacetum coccineum]